LIPGGIAVLNHRLQAWIPPGSFGWSFDDPVVSRRSTTRYTLGSRRDHPDRPISDHFPDVRKMVPRRLFADHFVGVNKMVPAGHSERCAGINAEAGKLEAKIAENAVELLEA
jgi:hypothetical protein